MKRIKLGTKVKDNITGLIGIAVVRSEFLNGCVQYDIQPPLDKDGKIVESVGIDIQQLEVVKQKKNEKVKIKPSTTGGRNNSSRKMRGY